MTNLNQQRIIFIDRLGNEHFPTGDDIITDRRGVYSLFVYQNKVLIHWPDYSPGVADLIGGAIDEGENEMEALWREVEEETGFVLEPMSPVNDIEYKAGFYAIDLKRFCHQTFYTYYFDVNHYKSLFFDGQCTTPENGKMEWVNIGDVESLPINKIHMHSINSLLL